jgi:hypothetical protein
MNEMPSHGPVVKHTFGNGAELDENSGDEGAFNDPQANEVVIKRAYGGKKKKKNDDKEKFGDC